jgi:hypothetical protein
MVLDVPDARNLSPFVGPSTATVNAQGAPPDQRDAPHDRGGSGGRSTSSRLPGSASHFGLVRSYTVTPPTVVDEKVEDTQELISDELPEPPTPPPGPPWPEPLPRK